ncbi:helix-turn-helix domain-containing protein [Planococcus versutus]|uniref:Transcriptional regulator in cluster with unspecified monosaccharide ABC transporter n=1 Tax=Planococcus versutus TaxID=1302659 RepID=A0A1B1S492_9BACL|nr:RodZ domain-containing protein [Planococcus versutus]ANU28006.1 transcriptional regulator in cluster with unspecified monosaccharide ABC transporter [Planococcus versutus]
MNELGTRLKEARIAKKISLEDLQDVTKIQKRYLAGIEEGEYSTMPGAFYVRAFIKQYAAAVDLDGEALLQQYPIEMPVKEPHAHTTTPTTYTSRSRSITRTAPSDVYSEVIPKVLVALFIVLILAVAWYFYDASTNGASSSDPIEKGLGVPYEEPASSVQEKPDKPVKEETPKETEEKQPDPILIMEETQGETTTYSFQGANPELEIAASGPSWVAATDENLQERLSKAHVLQAGETEIIDLSDVEFIRVRIGDYSNINLSLNGETIEYAQQTKPQNIVIQFKVSE